MKCAIFLAEGFETCEALIVVDLLRRAAVSIDTVSITDSREVMTSHNIKVETDLLWNQIDPENYDVLILPGGKLGTKNLEAFEPLKKALSQHYEDGRLTCAICAAPSIFGHMGLLKGKHYTCFPTFDEAAFGGSYEMELAVTDGNLITARGMGASIEFARAILKKITDEQTLANVENGIQYEHTFRIQR